MNKRWVKVEILTMDHGKRCSRYCQWYNYHAGYCNIFRQYLEPVCSPRRYFLCCAACKRAEVSDSPPEAAVGEP